MFSFRAFSDELQKLAVSKDQLSIPQTRSGRRSMSVDTLLKKEKDGSLYKRKLSGWQDSMSGGEADDKEPRDFDEKALAKGRDEEREHTDSKQVATEIAMDHLSEDPDYYEKLERIDTKTAFAWSKLADSSKPSWLEMGYSTSEHGLQNVPVRGKARPGDAPLVDEGLTEGQKPSGPPTWTSPETSIAPKVAMIDFDKMAATLGWTANTMNTLRRNAQAAVPQVSQAVKSVGKTIPGVAAHLGDAIVPTAQSIAHTAEQAFAKDQGAVNALKSHLDASGVRHILEELPAVRSGVSSETAYSLMGADPRQAQKALLGMWNNTVPVHMRKAAAWRKLAAVMGRQVKSPTDVAPDVEGPQNRMQMGTERHVVMGSLPDAQPLTGSSSDAYQRA